jgi:hypothetical protein
MGLKTTSDALASLKNRTFKTRSLLWAAAAGAMALMINCAPESPKLKPMPIIANEKISANTEAFSPAVDILFVIASDSSMAEHQKVLAANAQKFTDEIFNNAIVDYHVGVINAMSYDQHQGPWGGRLSGTPLFIDRSTANPIQALRDNLNVGYQANDPVALFTVVKFGLTAPVSTTENLGFLRQDANLAIVFVTDTDPEDSYNDAKDFYNFLVQLKGGKKERVAVYLASADPGASGGTDCGWESGEDHGALKDIKAFSAPNSDSFFLCSDYGLKLAQVSSKIVSDAVGSMLLTRLPVPSTITVTYGPQVIPSDYDTGWTYDASQNAIHFGPHLALMKNPPPNSKIHVDFTAVGDPTP